MKKTLLFLLMLFSTAIVKAEEGLLYLEAQGIAGYSSAEDEGVYSSQNPNAAMQKNSIGFDYVRKLSTESREFGTAALQMRLAYDEIEDEAELQIYNAYLKGKTSVGDVWIGHNRIAYGLSSYWDTHQDLLRPMPMYGFGYDRDWGVGYSKDLEKGNIQASFSSGTGMPLRTKGNGIATFRGSYGVLNIDNYSAGLSFMGGEVLDTMGNNILDDEPKDIALVSTDFAYNYLNYEHKLEVNVEEKSNEKAFGGFYRFGMNFLEENRLKLEVQGTYTELENIENYTIGSSLSYKLTADLTSRLMYLRDHNQNDNRLMVQLYYYFGI